MYPLTLVWSPPGSDGHKSPRGLGVRSAAGRVTMTTTLLCPAFGAPVEKPVRSTPADGRTAFVPDPKRVHEGRPIGAPGTRVHVRCLVPIITVMYRSDGWTDYGPTRLHVNGNKTRNTWLNDNLNPNAVVERDHSFDSFEGIWEIIKAELFICILSFAICVWVKNGHPCRYYFFRWRNFIYFFAERDGVDTNPRDYTKLNHCKKR